MADIRPLIAGNWKMNGLKAQLPELQQMAEALTEDRFTGLDPLICVPATLLGTAASMVSATPLTIGAQDCHAAPSGAHTGDISAAMIKDCGATATIVGHSERRADHGERDTDVMEKAIAANDAGLVAIVCVGETRQQREDGSALHVVTSQLEGSLSSTATTQNTVIAYEPVWAIGTGLVPSLNDIEQMHDHIRAYIDDRFAQAGEGMRILYGGSLKPSNAKEILAINNVNGGLIGGASLKADDFIAICESAVC